MQERMAPRGPRAPSFIIERPRLTTVLDDATARIVLLLAPAGYGMTTLAREWLVTRGHAVWYAGGPGMADVAALALGLAQTLTGFAGQRSDQSDEAVERVQ